MPLQPQRPRHRSGYFRACAHASTDRPKVTESDRVSAILDTKGSPWLNPAFYLPGRDFLAQRIGMLRQHRIELADQIALARVIRAVPTLVDQPERRLAAWRGE
jgi:hypothetical protein